MSVRFEFLGPLKQLVDGQDTVDVQVATIAEGLEVLTRQFQGVAPRLLAENGSLYAHVNVYVNEQDIRLLNGLQTPLSPGDVVTVISAIAGG
jgi:molybdopterin converting factor small subunit